MTVAFPFNTASQETVSFSEWMMRGDDTEPEPIQGSIPGWDYDTDLAIGRHVELKPLEILNETGLAGHQVELMLNVIVLTGPSCYRTVAFSERIPSNDRWACNIDLTLNSRELAESLTLKTEIVLAVPVDHELPFVASAIGSRLYEDIEKIQLEGSLGRFPMELVDFGESIPGLRAGNAMWYLDWDPGRPEARFLGAVLLYINASQQEMADRIRNMEPVITSVLRCDVIRTMCEGMLRNEEFVTGSDHFDVDTVGGQVNEWLTEAFENMSTEALKMMMRSSPGRFEARIQEAFS
jgi:hypothetical protein